MAAAGQKLVREAMTHLKMRKGASLAQIRDQITSSYTGKVDVTKRGVLASALKGLLETGQVEKTGGNYKLLASTAKLANDEEDVPGRRQRLRRRHGGGVTLRRKHHRRRRRRRRSVKKKRHSRRRRRTHHRRRRHSRKRLRK